MLPEGLREETETEQLLRPGTDGLLHLHELLERVQGLIVLAGLAVVLVVAGAKLERYLMKRQLAVVDGAAEQDLAPAPEPEVAHGRRA